jgi:hypothetical protein
MALSEVASSRRVDAAITTLSGSASACSRAARSQPLR